MAKVSVVGAGSWGTALAMLLCNNGHDTMLWSHREEQAEELRTARENKAKLPGVKIPEEIHVTSDLSEALIDKDVIVMAVPSVAVRTTAKKMSSHIRYGQVIVNVAKGIEEGSLMTLTDMIEEEIPNCQACVLSGPSHAEEVSRGLPTTCVVGAKTRALAEYLQNIFMSSVFRVYISPDILGIELGAALKNVIAAWQQGLQDGLGYGDNTKAALITRGITEMERLGVAMGAKAETFYGLSGIGDLIVTCASVHSRNRKAGFLMGQGRTMEEAMKEVNMVVEGVYSAKAGMELAKKYHVEMPIIEQVNEVLFEGKTPADAVKELMVRDKKIENWDFEW